MERVIRDWVGRYLAHPEAVALVAMVVFTTTVVLSIGGVLAPVMAAVVIAFVLDAVVKLVRNMGLGESPSIYLVYLAFLGVFFYSLIVFIPNLVGQITLLFEEFPNMINKSQKLLLSLPDKYPEYLTKEHIDRVIHSITQTPELRNFGRNAISVSLSKIPSLVAWLVYLVLVPIMAFFFLKDAKSITKYFAKFFPSNPTLLLKVREQFLLQMGNYLRGKVVEMLIVGLVTYTALWMLGLPYSMVLSVAVGLSVFIPYVGAIAVTLPVVIVGLVHWGLTKDWLWMFGIYTIIQVLDGYVLVPLIFKEAVDLHPLATLIAIIVFGSIFGLWGVFFAIPLAIVTRLLVEYWPVAERA